MSQTPNFLLRLPTGYRNHLLIAACWFALRPFTGVQRLGVFARAPVLWDVALVTTAAMIVWAAFKPHHTLKVPWNGRQTSRYLTGWVVAVVVSLRLVGLLTFGWGEPMPGVLTGAQRVGVGASLLIIGYFTLALLVNGPETSNGKVPSALP